MELRLVVERWRENRLLCPDANSLICDLMFSCSRFLLVELLLFRYVFFRSSHHIAEAGVAGRHRDAELVEAETYERILGTSFIQDNLLFVLDRILGGDRNKKEEEDDGMEDVFAAICHVGTVLEQIWRICGELFSFLLCSFLISFLSLKLQFLAAGSPRFSRQKFSKSFGLGCSSR